MPTYGTEHLILSRYSADMSQESDEEIWEYKSQVREKTAKTFPGTSGEKGRKYSVKTSIIAHSSCNRGKSTEGKTKPKAGKGKWSVTKLRSRRSSEKRKSSETSEKCLKDVWTSTSEKKPRLDNKSDGHVTACKTDSSQTSATDKNSKITLSKDRMVPDIEIVDECIPSSSGGEKQGGQKCSPPTLLKRPADGHCPFCQMPFRCLILESPRWHTTECMDVPIISTKDCPNGLSCESTIPSHYRKYKHSLLAEKRAGVTTPEPEMTTVEVSPQERTEPMLHSPRIPASSGTTETVSSSKSPYFCGKKSPKHGTHNSNFRRKLFTPPENEEAAPNALNTGSKDDVKEIISLTSGDTFGEDKSEGEDVFYDADEALPTGNSIDEKNVRGEKKLVKDGSKSSSEMSIEELEVKTSPAKHTQSKDGETQSIDASPEETFSEAKEILVGGEDEVNLIEIFDVPFDDDDIEIIPNQTDSHASKTNESSKMEYIPMHKTSPKSAVGRQTSIQSFFSLKNTKAGGDSSKVSQSNPKQSTSSFSWTSLFTGKKGTTEKVQGSGQQVANRSSYQYRGKKPCPFYKKMPGTPFTVDAFRYGSVDGCSAYFLTHFHYDHYGGLTRKFQHPIYCSKITGNLVQKKLGVDRRFINVVPLDVSMVIEGVEVTFMEANHCPGSVIILFRLSNGTVILHTGDFRANVEMENYPQLRGIHVSQLYLDTTYCNPAYAFPAQKDAIAFAVNKASEFVHQNPHTLVVVGSYTIGKERIFLAIAEDLDAKICVTQEKKNILDCLEDPCISKRITLSPHEARVHVLPMRQLNYQNLSRYLETLRPRYQQILAFEPTGWTHGGGTRHVTLENLRPKLIRDDITVYGVPYSEHSSYTEMKRFCQYLRPDRILATVNNGDPASRKKMDGIFSDWMKERTQSPSSKVKQSNLKNWFTK